MWLVKIYPFMITKKKLRFFYLYTQTKETGLSIDHIIDIYVCVAISREGKWQENLKEIVDIVLDFSKSTSISWKWQFKHDLTKIYDNKILLILIGLFRDQKSIIIH